MRMLANWLGLTHRKAVVERYPEAPQAPDLTETVKSEPARTQHTLRSLKIISASILTRLETDGIITVSDLLESDLGQISRQCGLTPREVRRVRSCRKAITLALKIRSLNPRNARLLIAVHRGTPDRISRITPMSLHKDIERFALSTPGMRMLGNRPLPTLELVRRWVESAKRLQSKQMI